MKDSNRRDGGDAGMAQGASGGTFDLFRLTKSKAEVDLAPNTIRAYALLGLRIYRCGRAAFISRTELAAFIRRTGSSGAGAGLGGQ